MKNSHKFLLAGLVLAVYVPLTGCYPGPYYQSDYIFVAPGYGFGYPVYYGGGHYYHYHGYGYGGGHYGAHQFAHGGHHH